MKLVKQIGYKLIVAICIVSTFCCFLASTPVEASKVNTSDFYYSGTVKGSYTIDKGFFEIIAASFGAILDYIAGLMTMAVRVIFVGWTAFMERCLTWILEAAAGEDIEIDKVSTTDITGSDNYITIDAIFFNRVPLLDINVFNFEIRDDVTSTGMQTEKSQVVEGETETHNAPMIIYADENYTVETEVVQGVKNEFQSETETEEDIAGNAAGNNNKESLILILKKAIAGWYYSFRVISIMIMLILLVYIGLKLAIQSSTSEKALYKRILLDWVVGMILVFSIHYIMLFIIQFNEMLVEQMSQFRDGATGLKVYEYGLIERAEKPIENDEVEMTLYEEVKTRAYDAKLTVGFSGMVMYMVLVYYAWKYTFIYLKRYLTVAVLVMIAPLVAVSYAFNKVRSGKSSIFSKWLKEFFFIVILQSIHALIYIVFLDTILAISLNSIAGMILAFVLLNFMSKSESIFRKIFNITGDLTDRAANGNIESIGDALAGMSLGVGASKAAVGITKKVGNLSHRIATKPIRVAAGAGFGKVMEKAANNKEFKLPILNTLNNDWREKKKLEEVGNVNKVKLGTVAIQIQAGKFNDEDEMKKAILALKEAVPFTKEVDNQRVLMDDDEYVEEFMANKEQYIQNYNKLTTKGSKAKRYISNKWMEIMDPYKYTERDEYGKYKVSKNIRENGDYHYFGKKTDGFSATVKSQFNATNILGLTPETKKALKGQLPFIKEEILGFGALLLGMPMLITNPAIGMGLLGKGIHSANVLFNNKEGRARKRNLKNFVQGADGKYYKFNSFEGSSPQTIANGVQSVARENYEQVVADKAKLDNNMVNRVKLKFPKLYQSLALGGGTLAVSGAIVAFTPVTLPIAVVGTAAGALSATIANARKRDGGIAGNAYLAMQETLKAAKKQNAEVWKNTASSTKAFLDDTAERYVALDDEKLDFALNSYAKTLTKNTQEFEIALAAILTSTNQQIDQMSDEELKRETKYEEELQTETVDGKIKLAGDTERKIIDDAIIDYVRKAGNIEIQECNLKDSDLEKISKSILDKLKEKGITVTEEFAGIEDIKGKIKHRKTVLDKERPKAVEESIADEAIIETMQAHKLTNPDQLDMAEVMENAKMKMLNPTEQTSSVMANMQAKKPVTADASLSDKVMESMQQIIVARKTILTDKASQPLEAEASKKMRAELKRKKAMEIAGAVIETEDKLTEKKGQTNNLTEPQIEQSAMPEKSEDVIKLLELQTKMYRDKTKIENVVAKKKPEIRMAFRAEMFNNDGSVRIDEWKDGTRRTSAAKDGSRKANSNRDGSRAQTINTDGSKRAKEAVTSADINNLLKAALNQKQKLGME